MGFSRRELALFRIKFCSLQYQSAAGEHERAGWEGVSPVPLSRLLWLGSDVYLGGDSFTKLVLLGTETKGSQSRDAAHHKWQQLHWILPSCATCPRGFNYTLSNLPPQLAYAVIISCHEKASSPPGLGIIALYPLPPRVACILSCLPSQVNTVSNMAQVEARQLFCTQPRPRW